MNRESSMVSSVSSTGYEKKQWWISKRRIINKYIKDARSLIATQQQDNVASAIILLDAALALSPQLEIVIELKARSLLFLRRFKDVADMLLDCIPSVQSANNTEISIGSSDSNSSNSATHSSKLLPMMNASSDSLSCDSPFLCFPVRDLKKKVKGGVCKKSEKEGQWRYWVLGQACCHLGLMEDAMALLQSGKRLSAAAFRRESVSWSEDGFSLFTETTIDATTSPTSRTLTESENISQLLTHIKLLLRRRTAALAALDAGLPSEAVRHFSKIVDGRRTAPQGFLAECYMDRAVAYRSAGRIAESIADCNKTLALEPSCIQALETRASLLESLECLPDCLHDLEHLKLLYNSILRDRKLPGPRWKKHNVRYGEIPGKLSKLITKIDELKTRVSNGAATNVDYSTLLGISHGCSRSELKRAHLLLCLRHKPEKSTYFIERCDFSDGGDVDSVRDRAKISSLLLYRLIQKGYSTIMSHIIEEEVAEKQKKKAAATAALQAALQAQRLQNTKDHVEAPKKPLEISCFRLVNSSEMRVTTPKVFQGGFCRDMGGVGNLQSLGGFSNPLPIKFEALTC